jgi:2,5-diketo-D-gluconate reductase A
VLTRDDDQVELPRVRLRSGLRLPLVGLGTWPLRGMPAERTVATALDVGHRLIDTAAAYDNEADVGAAVRSSAVPREDVVVVTKLARDRHGVDLAEKGFRESVTRLGLDRVDLFLVHWPNPSYGRYVDAWRGLLALQTAGIVAAVGTSNFTPAHLRRLVDETGIAPEVNQIQLNPYVPRSSERAIHRELGIVTQSWSPLGGPGAPVLRDPVVREIARAHGRTPAQIVLRWHIEIGSVPIAKSSVADRQRESLGLFDFALDPGEIAALTALDRGAAAAIDSDRVSR